MQRQVSRIEPFPGWDGSSAGARVLQAQLAAQVSLHDDYTRPLRTIAGFDVGFEDEGATTRAAAVLLDAATLEVVASEIVRLPTRMPYVPGLLSFRELPALLDALALLKTAPDLALIDGQGIAHPRRLGIAAHFGVASGLPALGVAKSLLTGHCDPPGPQPGQAAPITDRGQMLGWALRSKARCRPLYISPGHRVCADTALALVQRCLAGYRLPEPTRLADRLASRRDPPRRTP